MPLLVKEPCVSLENSSFLPSFHYIYQPQLNSHLSLSNFSLRSNSGLMATDASDWQQNYQVGEGCGGVEYQVKLTCKAVYDMHKHNRYMHVGKLGC